MPIEIKELVVRAHMVENRSQQTNGETVSQSGTGVDSDTKQKIVKESVAQVLAILERKRTR